MKCITGAIPLLFLLCSACASTIAGAPAPGMYTQTQTVQLENSDRINRFQRLATIEDVAPPEVDQLVAAAGTAPTVNGPVPVVRVVFRESVFFASGSDVPLPQAAPVFDMIAANMAHDVPDAALTILGHTDAIGGDAYNMDLSKRRALAVMQQLADRGVNIAQMSTVAIGFHQPIAPNDTPEGRALNRRVEFLISANPDANLSVVQQIPTDPDYFKLSETQPTPPQVSPVVEVYVPQPSVAPAPAMPPLAPITEPPAAPAPTLAQAPAAQVQAAPVKTPALVLTPVAPMQVRTPEQLVEAPLQPPPLLVERPLSPVAGQAPVATASNAAGN